MIQLAKSPLAATCGRCTASYVKDAPGSRIKNKSTSVFCNVKQYNLDYFRPVLKVWLMVGEYTTTCKDPSSTG
jgi:hypothetical protein